MSQYYLVRRPSRKLIEKAKLYDYWLQIEGQLNNFSSYLIMFSSEILLVSLLYPLSRAHFEHFPHFALHLMTS